MARSRTLTTLLMMLLALLLAAGCGGSDDDGGANGGGDTTEQETGDDGGGGDEGKSLFAETCGSCHTLADAGTSGTVGPNLDEAKPDEGRVRTMIEQGGNGMPPNLLEGEDADTVAAYVAENAGA